MVGKTDRQLTTLMTMTDIRKEDVQLVVQEAMLFGINKGASVERRKHFGRYVFMLVTGVVIGVLAHAIGATL